MQEAHPDEDVYSGARDEHLNEHGYIVPGLGEAGDVERTEDGLRGARYRTAGTPFRCTEGRVRSPAGEKLR